MKNPNKIKLLHRTLELIAFGHWPRFPIIYIQDDSVLFSYFTEQANPSIFIKCE